MVEPGKEQSPGLKTTSYGSLRTPVNAEDTAQALRMGCAKELIFPLPEKHILADLANSEKCEVRGQFRVAYSVREEQLLVSLTDTERTPNRLIGIGFIDSNEDADSPKKQGLFFVPLETRRISFPDGTERDFFTATVNLHGTLSGRLFLPLRAWDFDLVHGKGVVDCLYKSVSATRDLAQIWQEILLKTQTEEIRQAIQLGLGPSLNSHPNHQ